MRRIIYQGPDFTAVTENGILVEYAERDDEGTGEILIGKTDRLMPGAGCAFVRIGRKKDGYLPLKENSLSFTGEKLQSGEVITVQIKHRESEEKGAMLTRDITLCGKCVIIMPLNRYIGVSNRIQEENERERLKKTGREIAGGRFGIIMRADAANVSAEKCAEEAAALFLEWERINRDFRENPMPGRTLYCPDAGEELVRDYQGKGIDEICAVKELPAELRRQLHAADERKVRIANGGNIIIDRCEAMTVIDVNTGGAESGNSPEQTILQTNLSACDSIAAQVRLRNLGGILLIDFIDMKDDGEREAVSRKLKEVFAEDRRKTVLHGWTALGLMEMTRKRT